MYLPQRSTVTKMKCQVTSNITHGILISNKTRYRSYKQICIGEPKKVNLGYNAGFSSDTIFQDFKIENNSIVHITRNLSHYLHGNLSSMPLEYEILVPFFSTHNIEPNWLDCNFTFGWYDDEQGRWRGCVGKV